MNGPIREKKFPFIFLGILLLALLGLLLYSNILYAPFVFDDYSGIVDNDLIKNLKASLKDVSNNRYIILVSFALNYAVGGLKPFGYHLINNLVHIINAVLIYYLIILTFKTPFYRSQNNTLDTSRFFIAFSSAFVFVAHPIQTQAVTYIVQRSTSMATMFYLLSLVMYAKFRIQDTGYRIQDKSPPLFFTKGGKRRITKNHESCTMPNRPELRPLRLKSMLCYLTSVISAIFAMKTKEIAFTLPLIIVFFEFCFFSDPIKSQLIVSNWKRFFYLFPILLTILIIPLSMLNIKGPIETIVEDIDIQSKETMKISRVDYLLTQFRVIMTYLRLLIFPVNQSLDYSYPIYHSFFNPEVFLSFFCLLLIFGIAVYLFYRSRLTAHGSRLIAFGIFWFFITLSVESSIIPIKDVIFEHRLYLPSIGFFIASILLIEHILSYTKIKIVLIVVIVMLLSIATYNRNIIWKDPQLLWEDVITKFPNNPRACNELGIAFKEKGEFDKAIEQSEKSLRINHRYAPAYYNLGDIQYKLENYKDAIAYFKRVLELKLTPQLHLATLNSLGIAQSEKGDDENAVNAFKEALRLFPSSVVAYNNLGRQYIKMGEFDEAIETLKKGLMIRESPHLRYNLSLAYAKENGNN